MSVAAPEAAPSKGDGEGGRGALASAAPALTILTTSFLHTELLHGSWDRLNAILSIVSPARSNVNDALPAMSAAQALLADPRAPIYDMTRTDAAAFLYPPIAAALYAPHVASGSSATASLVAVNRVVFALVGLLLAATLAGPRRRLPRLADIAWAAVAIVLFLPMARALELNQASLYVALFLGATWVALDRGALGAAGVFLAMAAAVKPHLFAVAPLLWFHARRASIAAGLTGLILLVFSVGYAGVSNHVTYLTHVLPEASRGYAFFPNQSFGGLLHRLFSDVPIHRFLLMAPSPFVMRATFAAGAVLYASTFVVLYRARSESRPAPEAFALAWLVTTMIAPIAWGHHYAAALFPLAWLWRRARDGEERTTARFGLVAAGCALLGSYFVVGGLTGSLSKLLASYGLFGALLIAIVFARTFMVAARQAAPDEQPRAAERMSQKAAGVPFESGAP